MWRSIVELDMPQVTIWRMPFACWIIKTTDTEYVILVGFPRQQWLCERAPLLHYTYIACRVLFASAMWRIRPYIKLYIWSPSWGEMCPARDEFKRAWSYTSALAASLCGAFLYIRATVYLFYAWEMRDWS